MATLDTEVRKLQPLELCTLGQILSQQDAWKKLMAIIPKNDNENSYMFNNEHFVMIEQAARQQQRSAADTFLSEWSTIGKKRPTCRSMLYLLTKANLFRAADYLAVNVLKGSAPERPKFGPAAKIDVSEKALEELLKQQVEELEIAETPEERSMAWSVHFVEKPIEVVAAQIPKEKLEKDKEAIQSDLMKFSNIKSDLMKFSETTVNSRLPENVSDLIKFSHRNAENNSEDLYYLQEARTEDLPLCVRETELKSKNAVVSNESQLLESTTSTESSGFSEKEALSDYQIELPDISQNIIPAVVQESNKKEFNKEVNT